MTDNERKFYKDAWQVQDASNIRGVTTSFAAHLDTLAGEGRTEEELRAHPATLAWMDKINCMMGRPAATPSGRDTEGHTLQGMLVFMWTAMCEYGKRYGIGETEIRQNATTMAYVSSLNAMLGNPEDEVVLAAMDKVLSVVKEAVPA